MALINIFSEEGPAGGQLDFDPDQGSFWWSRDASERINRERALRLISERRAYCQRADENDRERWKLTAQRVDALDRTLATIGITISELVS